MPFEELSHTGDLQYRVTAGSESELFEDAARALYQTITGLDAVEPRQQRTIDAEAQTREELLIEFLRRCLHLFNLDGFVARGCSVEVHDGTSLHAVLRGEVFNPERHPFGTEIKAVTYHGASVERTGKGYEAVFTLDL